jgi:hypothetical protein
LFITLEGLLDAFQRTIGASTLYQDWLAYLRRRYVVEQAPKQRPLLPQRHDVAPVTSVMATPSQCKLMRPPIRTY